MRRRRTGSLKEAILLLGALGVACLWGACAGGAGGLNSAAQSAATPGAELEVEKTAVPAEEAANSAEAATVSANDATVLANGQVPDPFVPIRLDAKMLGGVGLTEEEALPSEMVLEGGSGNRGHIFFSSDQIVVEVWEADASTLAIAEPLLYDEFVTILSGRLILTDQEGRTTEYETGESLVVPKGFSGLWQMVGNYRELIVIEKAAYELAYGGE